MEICITIGGIRHCYEVPIVELPIPIHKPGRGPVNYPWLIRDAVILAASLRRRRLRTPTFVKNSLEDLERL